MLALPAPQLIDWSGLRVAAAGMRNVDRAALIAGHNLPESERQTFLERVRKRSQRENWKADWHVQTVQNHDLRTKSLSSNVQNGAVVIANAVSANCNAARTFLSKAALNGAKAFAKLPGEALTERDKSGALRNVTAAAAQIGGWDVEKREGDKIMVNVAILGQ